jgi:hypothetical protein
MIPVFGSHTLRSGLKVVDLGQELAERIAAGHAPAVLAADGLAIGTGGVPTAVAREEVVALVQLKNNSDHRSSQDLVNGNGYKGSETDTPGSLSKKERKKG